MTEEKVSMHMVAVDNSVLITLDKPVPWMRFKPEEAIEFGKKLIQVGEAILQSSNDTEKLKKLSS